MKNNYSWLFLLLLMTACTPEAAPDKINPDISLTAKGDTKPDNDLNPYDIAGRLHDEIADLYYEQYPNPTTNQGIIDGVETVSNSHTDFISVKSGKYYAPTPARVQYFVSNPLTSTAAVIAASPLSALGKSNLSSFVSISLPLCETAVDYDTVYGIIALYEDSVLDSKVLTVQDKKIILTTTSILRYSAYRKRKPKTKGDRDWEIMITHVAATIEGAGYGIEEAITTALSVGIAEND